jgi:hypothetical protein
VLLPACRFAALLLEDHRRILDVLGIHLIHAVLEEFDLLEDVLEHGATLVLGIGRLIALLEFFDAVLAGFHWPSMICY